MYRVIRSVLIFSLVAVFVGCEYWNKDMLGYLEYWSETVQMGKVEVSDATIQKNDAGADTIPVAATPTIAAYVINPKSYELLAEIGDSSSADKSVRVSDSAVQSKALVVAHEPTLLKVQLGSADGSLEHTEFRVDFEAIRKDTMQSSGKVIGVTLRYNTPPVAPTPVVWNYDSSQYEVVKAGEKWEADRDGILYWAYDDSIVDETDPNCAKWFSIGGTRHLVADCKVKPNVQVDGLSVFQFNTNYGGTSVAAVDSEGISSPAIASGQAVPPAMYVIKYDANGADGGTAPASQNKTQYTDITLATNSGGLTRIGYRFTGWNTAPDGTGTPYSAGATYSADKSVTLYAQWEAVDAVALTPESSAVNHGATVTLTPPKSDATIYYRIGDATETTGTQGQPVTVTLYNATHLPQDANGAYAEIPEGGNVTITAYAKYADGTQSSETTGTYTLKQYTVRYEGGGDASGDVPAEQSFYSGGSVTVQGKDSLKKTGYTFAGWQGDDGQLYSQGNSYGEDENLTLTAQWDPNTYTVRFDPNGGSYGAVNPLTQQFTYDQPQPLTARQFTRTDYEFTGWNTQVNGSGTSYTDGQSISNLTDIDDGIVTLYAQWKLAVITLEESAISSAADLRTVLANYSSCKITVDLGGKQLEVTNSDLATNTEFFTVKDGNKVTITNGTVAVTGDFSTATNNDEFRLFSVKTGSTLDLSGCTLTGTNFGNAGGTAVEVSDGGSLTLTNTTISNFESNGNGAGVRVISGGSAIMNSGAIKNNNARYGAAVYLTGSFTMNGGEISGNTNVNGSTISGDGTFEWNEGTISNNQNGSSEGGSVFGSDINYSGTKDKNAAS